MTVNYPVKILYTQNTRRDYEYSLYLSMVLYSMCNTWIHECKSRGGASVSCGPVVFLSICLTLIPFASLPSSLCFLKAAVTPSTDTTDIFCTLAALWGKRCKQWVIKLIYKCASQGLSHKHISFKSTEAWLCLCHARSSLQFLLREMFIDAIVDGEGEIGRVFVESHHFLLRVCVAGWEEWTLDCLGGLGAVLSLNLALKVHLTESVTKLW